MTQVLGNLWSWLWHLLPANPIIVRVVQGASRRSRHHWLRVGYLGAILAVVLFSLVATTKGRGGSLAELAKGASQTFMLASMTQLALMCLLAPVFTAGAITQERDAQTFNILLSTPLTNAQIVFGSMMSRLYFLLMLLLAGLPIFLVTMVYGGVTTRQILESFALCASTALLTGALAICIAMIRVGTHGTIFLFYLLIAVYLLSIYFLGQWSATWVEASPPTLDGTRMSWLTPVHPFLALDVALNRVHAPSLSRLAGHSRVVRYALAYPSGVYVVWTSAAAFMLTVLSMLFVRRNATFGESPSASALVNRIRSKATADQRRPPRHVWTNPVAWREARTRASGGGVVMRLLIIVGGLIAGFMLFFAHVGGELNAAEVRVWLAALIIIQFASALIIATNTAATSMTRERESKTMDLLLTTMLTSKYVLWGKLRGLVSLAIPLLTGPVIVLFFFAMFAPTRGAAVPTVWVEAAFEVGALTLVYTACACVIALRISLVATTNVAAVMYSVGLLIFLCGVSWLLGDTAVRVSQGSLGAFLAPFTPFTSVWYLVNPGALFHASKVSVDTAAIARLAVLLGTLAGVSLYLFVIWSMYRGLVRNFDMIVRRQSGT
ncbi:MAG: ABC transporter permease subunit [Phycisphaerae bacterium]